MLVSANGHVQMSDLPSYDQPVTPLMLKLQEGMYRNYPTFQRNYRWTAQRRQLLIDSILRNYPIGSLFAVRDGSAYAIFDGKQRIETLFAYMNDEFATASALPERLKPIAPRRTYSALPESARAQFDNYRLRLLVWRKEDLGEHASLVFRRLNDGGIPLKSAEILYSYESEANARADELSAHPWIVAHTTEKQRNERVDHLYALVAMMAQRTIAQAYDGTAIRTYARGERTRGKEVDDVALQFSAARRMLNTLTPAMRARAIQRIPDLLIAMMSAQSIAGWGMRVPADLWTWIDRATAAYDARITPELDGQQRSYRPSSALVRLYALRRFWDMYAASLLEFVTRPT